MENMRTVQTNAMTRVKVNAGARRMLTAKFLFNFVTAMISALLLVAVQQTVLGFSANKTFFNFVVNVGLVIYCSVSVMKVLNCVEKL